MLRTYEKEIIYVRRDSEGAITDVFDSKTSKYHRVVDTAITIDSSKPEKEVFEWTKEGF